MREIWVWRSSFLLIGGLVGVFIPEPARFPLLGVFFLLLLRLWFWHPQDFFGEVYKPEIFLLAVSVTVGLIYGFTADRGLPASLILDRVQVTGILEDWTESPGKYVGRIKVQDFEFQGFVTEPMGGHNSNNTGSSGVKDVIEQSGWGEGNYRLIVYKDKNGNLPGLWPEILPGDRLSFLAKLERPKPAGTPGQFDYQLYYAVRGLDGILTARGDVNIITPGKPPFVWRIRQSVRNLLKLWPPEETGILEGILFGDSGSIPPEVVEKYRVTGVYHVFSASGSNVAFVLALVWGILKILPQPLRIGGTIGALLLYAVLCGGNLPIIRATVMGVAVLLGRLGRGQIHSLRWLLYAAVGLFAYNPLVLKDTGFQLSFLAAWGIIVLGPRIASFKAWRRCPEFLTQAVSASLAAQIATLPVLVLAFHRLSLIGLAANIAVLFILGSVLELGIVGVIFSFIPWMAVSIFQTSIWLLKASTLFLGFLAELPWADVWVLNPGFFFWFLWYGGMAVLLWGQKRAYFTFQGALKNLKRRILTARIGKYWVILRNKVFCFTERHNNLENNFATADSMADTWASGKVNVLMFVIILLLFLWSPWNYDRPVEIVFLDVGQGDSILVKTPEKQVFLIDTGPKTERFDAGERIVLPYLLQNRIKKLDALILTHEHEDHTGGARTLLENLTIEWIGVPDIGEALASPVWANIFGDADSVAGPDLEQSRKIKRLKAGDQIIFSSNTWLEVMAPGEVLKGTNSDENNNSLVIKLNHAGQSILLTADMEKEEMNEIAGAGMDLAAAFFKQPHHGSRFSLDKEWLDQISPRAVFISVGKNLFGHPSPEVLRYWEERDIPVYRTDEHGTIRLRLDNKGAEIITGR